MRHSVYKRMQLSSAEMFAHRAGGYKCFDLPADWDPGNWVMSQDQLEKFRQLVVKECIDSYRKSQHNTEATLLGIAGAESETCS